MTTLLDDPRGYLLGPDLAKLRHALLAGGFVGPGDLPGGFLLMIPQEPDRSGGREQRAIGFLGAPEIGENTDVLDGMAAHLRERNPSVQCRGFSLAWHVTVSAETVQRRPMPNLTYRVAADSIVDWLRAWYQLGRPFRRLVLIESGSLPAIVSLCFERPGVYSLELPHRAQLTATGERDLQARLQGRNGVESCGLTDGRLWLVLRDQSPGAVRLSETDLRHFVGEALSDFVQLRPSEAKLVEPDRGLHFLIVPEVPAF